MVPLEPCDQPTRKTEAEHYKEELAKYIVLFKEVMLSEARKAFEHLLQQVNRCHLME